MKRPENWCFRISIRLGRFLDMWVDQLLGDGHPTYKTLLIGICSPLLLGWWPSLIIWEIMMSWVFQRTHISLRWIPPFEPSPRPRALPFCEALTEEFGQKPKTECFCFFLGGGRARFMVFNVHMCHEKNHPTFHYTGWLIGILIVAYYNPYITG